MFVVKRRGRKQFAGKKFSSFEKARQAVRKYIRARIEKTSYNFLEHPRSGTAMWDNISRNPTTYGVLGFTIRKVA